MAFLNREGLTAKDAKDAKENEDKNFGTADERRLTRMKTRIEFFLHLRSLASIGGSNLLICISSALLASLAVQI
jgi:hypothetical protein